MTRLEQLYETLIKRYKESERFFSLAEKGEKFKWLGGQYDVSSNAPDISIPSKGSMETNLYYDEENDTLSMWGRGLGLIYRKGLWAMKKGEKEPWRETINSSEIY